MKKQRRNETSLLNALVRQSQQRKPRKKECQREERFNDNDEYQLSWQHLA